MMAALLLPRVLDNMADRRVMLVAAGLLAVVLLAFAGVLAGIAPQISGGGSADRIWIGLLVAWGLLGLGYSGVLTPTGRLLRRSAQAADRPALFAAQFALSHACWLVTYPLAGWLSSRTTLSTTLAVLGAVTLSGVLLAQALWPADDPEVVEHEHADLSLDHPHLVDAPSQGHRHAHAFVIDDLHPHWPNSGALTQ